MINEIKDNKSIKDSGVMYVSTWNQIKTLYATNPQLAGELAISAFELLFTGEISSDDIMISCLLENTKYLNEKNTKNYNNTKEAREKKKIETLKNVADLYLKGLKQKDIAERLNISQQTVSKRLKEIKEEHPELLETNFTTLPVVKNSKNSTVVPEYQPYNDNVNVNENVNENENEKDNVYGICLCDSAQPNQELAGLRTEESGWDSFFNRNKR